MELKKIAVGVLVVVLVVVVIVVVVVVMVVVMMMLIIINMMIIKLDSCQIYVIVYRLCSLIATSVSFNVRSNKDDDKINNNDDGNMVIINQWQPKC